MIRPRFILILLLVICFSLAAVLVPRREAISIRGEHSDSFLAGALGEGRQMVADIFNIQADVYFHSGYYPSVFDQARQQEVEDSDVSHPEETNAPTEAGFLGPPQDWIDGFSRHFRPGRHTHLGGQASAEILPWLELSAELDPHRIQTYIVTSFFLRNYLGKRDEARNFLRAGLLANPDSVELRYELGVLFYENYKDLPRARNVWLGALRSWDKVEGPKPQYGPDGKLLRDDRLREKILTSLANEEEAAGHAPQAIEYFKEVKVLSPHPREIQKRIDELQATLKNSGAQTNQPPGH